MVRAAAKNHAHVGVAVDPDDYGAILAELRADGWLSAVSRRRLARAAFAHTAAYDAAIVTWIDETEDVPETLPPTLHLALERSDVLRYGENPHQSGARYKTIGQTSMWDDVVQHSGVALSYLNLFDADAAWRLAHDLGDQAAVAIIKHANPCGVAIGDDLARAYQQAFECDSRSAFGGIVATNRVIDLETVEAMEAAAQADVVIAPGYADGVVERLIAKRKNTRLLTATPPDTPSGLELRQIGGGYLVQDAHHFASAPSDWQVVTQRRPTDQEMADAAFAWRVCGHVTSNAIVLAKDGVAWGIGAGQQNRVESGEIAASKADGRAKDGACASDAFYPFPDGIEAAADAGAAIIVQPGGSVNDEKTIAAADARGVAMVFTGERHFLH
jgi:phosphoribosylaminoimidazolecarboxamide formyltransferase/IMP cyclohydrolase